SSSRALRSRHSFPTRRSSDLFDYVNALVTSTVRQSTEESSLDHLLWGALCVVAWLRAVNSAATGVMRCADGALACATSTLLTERSEEHTSELQSRFDLVCRLL